MSSVFSRRSATSELSIAMTHQPTGASLAWTSDDPIVLEARSCITAGRLREALELLTKDDPSASAEARVARSETAEMISRVRFDYSLSSADLLDRLKQSTPSVTESQLNQWRREGGVQWRLIDDEIAYFRREPKNMMRFCPAYKELVGAANNEAKAGEWKLIEHLKRVVAEADRTGEPYVLPIQTIATFTLTVPSSAPGMRPGAIVRAWLPFPQDYGRRQYDVSLLSATPTKPFISPSATGEHDVIGSPQRSAYFEHRVTDAVEPVEFQIVMSFKSQAYCPHLDEAVAQPLPAGFPQSSLGERLPHIAFTPELRSTVNQVVGEETNPLRQARLIFRWIDENIAYHAEESYSILPSFSRLCLARRRGDCGIQAMLFITMCRAVGIPARWQSGWQTKPSGWDMHDWAEFYVAPWGWLPADQSYGLQAADDPRIRDFYCGHQDSYRLIINRDYGSAFMPPKHSLRSEPADFQTGEVEIDGQNLYANQWSYDMKFQLSDTP